MVSAVESRNCGLLLCLSVITSALAAIRGVRPQITTRAFMRISRENRASQGSMSALA